MSIYIIYKTYCKPTKKHYIGQHVQKSEEFDGYFGSGIILKQAIKKYGKENFIRETVEYCTSANVNEREMFWIKEFSATHRSIGYNISTGGNNGVFLAGKVQPEESRRKQSLTMKGRYIGKNNPNYGNGDKIRGNKNPSKRKEVREKISEKLTNRIFSDEHCKNISKSKKGQKISKEVRELWKQQRKGINNSNYKYQYVISNINTGETIEILNETLKDYCKKDNRFKVDSVQQIIHQKKTNLIMYKKEWKIFKRSI